MEWIKVEDRLPDNDNEVLIFSNEYIRPWNPKGIRIGFLQMNFKLFSSADWEEDIDNYTMGLEQPESWMELPEPPKE